ncbi:AcrR family transcriptional regulator [Hamadaea flava]|uniref:TetR/AcrR family transcriptional regulator n=1 Tax=Hamadaea flava TaxID=1742688 RepID=A0ABV8LZ78_9ACTN|nr:TetR/AcrR family transcriptional regulator [Hamadaea flava]MCP2321646.1 AcrR family transcriptional regulator [Hamadaea flava]
MPDDDRKRRILDAALELADERGLAGVTMRALAQKLGVTAMALYPHIGDKEGLFDGLVDRMLAEMLPAVPTDGTAEERLLAVGRAARELSRRHPSAYALLLARPAVTPDAVRLVDAIYGALLDLGVPDAEVPRVERLITTFALGYAASEASGRFSAGTINPRGRRAQFPADEVSAHRRLSEVLDRMPDWDAEYEADLQDLLLMVRARWS